MTTYSSPIFCGKVFILFDLCFDLLRKVIHLNGLHAKYS